MNSIRQQVGFEKHNWLSGLAMKRGLISGLIKSPNPILKKETKQTNVAPLSFHFDQTFGVKNVISKIGHCAQRN